MSVRDIRQAIRFISKNYTSRCLTYEHVHATLGIKALAHTIPRELRWVGYRRCITCPRPFSSRAQVKRRLCFARVHRWWGTSDYAVTWEGGGTTGRLFGQMNTYGRQEERDGPILHDERTKSGVLHIYGPFIGQEGLQ